MEEEWGLNRWPSLRRERRCRNADIRGYAGRSGNMPTSKLPPPGGRRHRVRSPELRVKPEQSRPTRADRYAEFSFLRKYGRTPNQIASACRVCANYVRDVLDDPDGNKARARKAGYRGVCVDCGRPTNGSSGRARAPERCVRCSNRKIRLYWTHERIIEAIERWVTIHGEPPTTSEWGRSHHGAPEWRKKRMAETPGRWPELRVVQGMFGSWANAIEAAGYQRPRRGPPDRLGSSRPGPHRSGV
jgi:hypothetical protein